MKYLIVIVVVVFLVGFVLVGIVLVQDLFGFDVFVGIIDEIECLVVLFDEMGKVLIYLCCLNCYLVMGGLMQGDDMYLYLLFVVWGDVDFGVLGMNCLICYGMENMVLILGQGSILGYELWLLVLVSMGWVGKLLVQICVQIKDLQQNGGKMLDEFYEYNVYDGLVGWGWDFGEGCIFVFGSQDLFGQLICVWIDIGVVCFIS